jgi:DNA-directed RNA polymerase specialized sigma24 family protein
MPDRDTTFTNESVLSRRAWLEARLDRERLFYHAMEKSDRDPHVARQIVEQVLNILAQKPEKELTSINLWRYARNAVVTQATLHRRDRARLSRLQRDLGVSARTPRTHIGLSNELEALELLAMLREDCREALIRCRLYGYTADEVARQLQVSPSEVRRRVATAFEFLVRYTMQPRRGSRRSRMQQVVNRRGTRDEK